MFSPIRPTARLNQRRFGGGRSWFSDLGLELGLLLLSSLSHPLAFLLFRVRQNLWKFGTFLDSIL